MNSMRKNDSVLIPRNLRTGLRSLVALFSVFLLVALFSAPVQGQEGAPERISAFADHLFDQEDYYRAITEYERLIFLFPKHPLAKTAEYRIALAYFKGEKLPQAIQRLRKISEDRAGEDLGKQALATLGDAYVQKKEYTAAIEVFDRFLKADPGHQQADAVRIKIGWAYLRQGNWRQASEEFRKLPQDSPLRQNAEGLAQDAAAYPDIPAKSPVLAGGLSAVLPGAGQLYVGRPTDAAISFALNSVFLWATIEAFNNDNNVTGAILLFFESGWYLGNVYNAVNNAHKYNRRAEQTYLDRLSNQYGISFTLDSGAPVAAFTARF